MHMDGVLYDDDRLDKIYDLSEIQQSSVKATLRSREDLKVIRLLSFLAAILQLIVSVILCQMGFSHAVGKEDFSPTIVLCAFGSLICCIWACVGCYETFAGSRKNFDLPSWSWHNDKFSDALAVSWIITFLLWPAIVLFVIHNKQADFLALILGDVSKPDFKVAILTHMMASPALMAGCGAGIIWPTKWLRNLNAPEGDGEEDEDMVLPPQSKYMITSKFCVDLLYLIDMILLIVAQTKDQIDETGKLLPGEVNSGLVCMLLIHCACILPFLSAWRQRRGLNVDVEGWLHKWRSASAVHLFFATVISWTAACVFVLVAHFNADFWATLLAKELGMVYLQIALFFGYMIVYGFLLYCHHRCMSSLDEIASLHLIEKHGATGVDMDAVDEDEDDDDDEDDD